MESNAQLFHFTIGFFYSKNTFGRTMNQESNSSESRLGIDHNKTDIKMMQRYYQTPANTEPTNPRYSNIKATVPNQVNRFPK